MPKVKTTAPEKITMPGQIREALLAGCLDAKRLVRVAEGGLEATKHIIRNGETTEVPDHLTRLKYLEYITHTIEGTPVRRQEIITKELTTHEDLKLMAKQSPSFRQKLRELADGFPVDLGT